MANGNGAATGQQQSKMSVLGVHPPGFLNMSSDRLAEEFEDFKQSWEIFVLAAEIDDKSDVVKVALLKNFLGIEAVKVLNTIIAPAQQLTPDSILTALEGYCLPQANETYERFLFNTATQRDNEDVNQFVSRLRQLSGSCNYGELKDSLIRDRIVVGVRSDDTRKALLKTANLTLATAIDMCRAQKLVDDRMQTMRIKDEPQAVEGSSEFIAKVRASDATGSCRYCGFKSHRIGDRENCPANGVTCRNCGKQNHYARMCRSKKLEEAGVSGMQRRSTGRVKVVEEHEEDSEDSDYITCVEEVSVIEKKITSEVKFACDREEEPKKIRCLVDTGASCNVITVSALESFAGRKIKLEPSNTKLKGFGGQIVPAVGRVVLRHRRKDKCFNVVFQVVKLSSKVLQMPLLGHNTCKVLGIVSIHDVDVCEATDVNESSTVKNKEAEIIVKKFEDVFVGDGRIHGKVSIELNSDIVPKQQEPRRVPVSLKEKLQGELEDLEKRGIIARVEDSTEWTSNIVIVVRKEKVRICLDPIELNSAIKRPRFQMTTLEEILPELHNVKVFSTLDVRNGFWHVELTEQSSLMTAFWTPVGRYVWKRLPFGLSCSPEIFQQKLQGVLQGLKGIEVLVDDILVVGRGDTVAEAVHDHNRNLAALLQRCREAGVKLNKSKMKLNQTQVRFFGHVLTKDGLEPDPSKTTAIKDMPIPEDAAGLQRFLGLVNYMAKFIPNLSEACGPLRELLVMNTWTWKKQHTEAFETLKRKIAKITLLKFFNPKLETTVQCDASSYALGAVLLQEGQPILFASRVLSATEQRYAQIEKETLAILFACKRFDQYIFGNRQVTVETDHLPLQSIFKKPLALVPKRIQRMILSLQRYNLNVKYLKGSKLVLADTLSRNLNVKQSSNEESDLLYKSIEEINALECIEIQDSLLQNIKRSTEGDEVSSALREYIMNGWPKNKESVPDSVKPYYEFHCELVMQEGIILRGDRIVVPVSSRKNVLDLLHYSHQGEQATLRMARSVVYWPNMNDHIRNFIKKCEICNKFKPFQRCEPMQSSAIPSFPYDVVSLDVGELSHKGKKMIMLVTVDHFSNYFDVDFVPSQSTSVLIECTKKNFSRLGIPRLVITDSAKQFTGTEWQRFVREYGIKHATSAPYHHEANGKAESAIKIAKSVVKKALQDEKDVWLALLEWRNTPQADGYSPLQKLMGRKSRGLLPVSQQKLQIQPVDGDRVREEIEQRKVKSKFYHDRKAQSLPALERGQEVYVQLRPESSPEWSKGRVAEVLTDRDYQVEVEGAIYRRNRKYVRDAHVSLDCGENENQFSQFINNQTQESFVSASGHLGSPTTSTPRTSMNGSYTTVKSEPYLSDPLAVAGEPSPTPSGRATSGRPVRVTRRPLKFADYVLEDQRGST